MAASDHNPRFERLQPDSGGCPAADAMNERLREEIGRAERFGTRLSCLLVVIDNLEQMARDHGDELRQQAIDYVAGALRRELRCFDRVGRIGRDGAEAQDPGTDLLIVIPGADGPRGEIVARRALERLHTIKIEADGTRQALEISVGLAAWQGDVSAEAMVEHARAALCSVNGDAAPTQPPTQPTAAAPAHEAATKHARQPPEPTTARIRAGGP
ncbi:MAG TPA: GGDEF domain-containing protein [Solirubrobacteraceae bacterium]|jgi:diguanylate cyclase (GGDEF)-like protein|nr:GGDEF domain-containing protein [Solirubrobacteraceae bacterium]